MKGVVKKLNADKLFGFIRTENGDEYFFHKSGVTDGTDWSSIREGDFCTFTVAKSPKGPRAEDVNFKT